MNCFIGILMIAGIGINPCNINKMEEGLDSRFNPDPNSCRIEFNSGNAWSGTDNVTVKTSCTELQKTIERKMNNG